MVEHIPNAFRFCRVSRFETRKREISAATRSFTSHPRFFDTSFRRFAVSSFLLVISLILSISAQAQDVKVAALVNENTIGTEETVVFSLEVKGASFANVETPQVPETDGLTVLQAIPSTQRSYSFINGIQHQSVTFQWRFRPSKQGTAHIRPLTVFVKAKRYRTEEIRITVVPQSQRPQRQAQRRNPFGRMVPQRRVPATDPPESRSRLSEEDLFIRAVPSARQAYQNEQVTLEYQLYFRPYVQPRESRLADSWDAEGFWREERYVDGRPVPRTVTRNGVRFNMITLKRVAVFPTRAGKLTIDPLRIDTEVLATYTSRDPVGRLFSQYNPFESVELTSSPIEIETKPLPPNAPDSFQGAVGQYDMTTRIDQTEVQVGEPVQVRMRVAGTGNLALLDAPLLDAPGVFEVYGPEVAMTMDSTSRQVRGSKTFTYVLVPRSNGTFDLPAFEFAYFDPRREAYETIRSDDATIRVTGTATTPVAASTTGAGLPVDDIAGLMMESRWVQLGQTPLYRSAWTYLALLFPFLLVGGVVLYHRRATRLVTDVGYARNRRAHPVARKHLKQAQVLLKEDKPRAFYEEVERAVLSFIGNRLNLPERGLTHPQLDARLAEHGIPETHRRDLLTLLKTCDQARFAPTRPPHEHMEAATDEAYRLISAIDDAFTT